MAANDHQVGGAHYQVGYQPWDFIADMGFDYFLGNAVKYVSRWRSKGGVKDLEKARHYLEKWGELLNTHKPRDADFHYVQRYVTANDLPDFEQQVLGHIVATHTTGKHTYVLKAIKVLSEEISTKQKEI